MGFLYYNITNGGSFRRCHCDPHLNSFPSLRRWYVCVCVCGNERFRGMSIWGSYITTLPMRGVLEGCHCDPLLISFSSL